MRARIWFAAALAASLATVSLAASTSDLAREKAYADQITDQLVVGEAVWLTAAGNRFLGLYTAPEGAQQSSKVAVILIHGRGVHPSWGFIETLRMELPEAGYHTLALQMPILREGTKLSDYARTLPEAFERLDAGVAHLKRRGLTKIYLVGHSLGATTAIAHVARTSQPAVNGLAAIGADMDPAGGPDMQPPQLLARVKLPVLDIFGDRDLDSVLRPAAARAAAAQAAGNRGFKQVKVPNADHFFTNHYDELKSQLLAWLKQVAK
jgi:pimeloyl-ACP methyl ester carboxylesterase